MKDFFGNDVAQLERGASDLKPATVFDMNSEQASYNPVEYNQPVGSMAAYASKTG